MFVVVPVKFDKCVGVNVAGIDYRVHSIGIEPLRVKSLCGTLTQIPKKSKVLFISFLVLKYSQNIDSTNIDFLCSFRS